MSGAYYNEIDPYSAQWLRNLIKAGHIAPGDVDERSIEDVTPNELRRYTQCHFFAGIGVWSYGMRLAGWSDDRPAWTGSCPCQPFSAAGKGGGFDDERHLWPAWFWLINELRPNIIFGEQVASKDANPWFDLVRTDLEGLEYAVAGVPFPSASVGAPHIRDRTFFLAHADDAGSQGWRGVQQRIDQLTARARRVAGRMADADGGQCDGIAVVRGAERDGQNAGRPQGGSEPESRRATCGLADASCERRQQNAGSAPCDEEAHGRAGRDGQQSNGDNVVTGYGEVSRIEPTGPTNGFWRDADWLLCRDEKWRPVRPGSFPLVDGAPARVGRLRAYGNAINAQQAKVFVECAMELL